MTPKGLGTGLGALFGEAALGSDQIDCVYLPIARVEPSADQPRKYFDELALAELAESIKELGMIQPITVRKASSGQYQIIAGERRWRAARAAGLTEVPCRILEADDRLAAEMTLVENLQREDLNPIEEALGYRTLIEEHRLTQEEAAARVGKSRPAVANALRLLTLPSELQDFLEQGALTPGHARAAMQLPTGEAQLDFARRIIRDGLSVRQAEALAKKYTKSKPKADAPISPDGVDYIGEVEKRLTRSLGRRVKLTGGGKKGKLEIDYYNSEDLENVIQALASLKLSKGKVVKS